MMAFVPQVALVLMEPLALAGLAAPLILLALGLRRQDSREAYLGTARFLSDETSGEDGQRKRSLPAWLWLTALALVLGVLALAKPGFEGAPPRGVVVQVQVDVSPSMYLPLRAADGALGEGETASMDRRIDAAWRGFCRWAEEYESNIPGRVFVSTAQGEPVHWREMALPPKPETAALETFWPAHDAPSTVWITDRAIDSQPRQLAGIFASGGDAIPGPVSLGADGGIYWNADGTTEFRPELGRSGVVQVGSGLPSLVADLAQLWAGARGLRLAVGGDGEGGPVELSLMGAPSAATSGGQSVVGAGRDGWEANLAVPSEGVDGGQVGSGWSPWLLDRQGAPIVNMAPGRVQLGFVDVVGAPSDEAAFAVSWIGLFDRARLSPNEVVEASERSAAGAALSLPPSKPAALESLELAAKREQQRDRAAGLRALLAGAAALLGLAAIVLLVRRG